jgi:glutamate synthase domain-containing protein 1
VKIDELDQEIVDAVVAQLNFEGGDVHDGALSGRLLGRAMQFDIIAVFFGLKQETSMCGIVGFLDRRGGVGHPVGRTLLAMLEALGCRGPDSAGVALFGAVQPCWVMQVKLPEEPQSAAAARALLESLGGISPVLRYDATGAYVRLELDSKQEPTPQDAERWVLTSFPGSEVVSLGHQLEIIKQVGSPAELERTYGVAQRMGSHGIGHTRLSTESRVDLSHSQPFWAHGVPDLATVHNGHITNYHKLRRRYEAQGHHFYTENDSELIGVYLRDRMTAGLSLEDALRSSLDDFDGSFSYLAAWEGGLAYVKDRFGFKPLVLAQTDEWVALATEEVALRRALGCGFTAREPAPGTMGVWLLSPEAATANAG